VTVTGGRIAGTVTGVARARFVVVMASAGIVARLMGVVSGIVAVT